MQEEWKTATKIGPESELLPLPQEVEACYPYHADSFAMPMLELNSSTPLPQRLTAKSVAATNWWGPIWRGLAVEETAKHYKAMGKALWLYIYLIVHANRQSGIVFRRLPTIAQDMGIPQRTIRAWLSILRKHAYVTTQSNGRGLTIAILKWKSLKIGSGTKKELS